MSQLLAKYQLMSRARAVSDSLFQQNEECLTRSRFVGLGSSNQYICSDVGPLFISLYELAAISVFSIRLNCLARPRWVIQGFYDY